MRIPEILALRVGLTLVHRVNFRQILLHYSYSDVFSSGSQVIREKILACRDLDLEPYALNG